MTLLNFVLESFFLTVNRFEDVESLSRKMFLRGEKKFHLLKSSCEDMQIVWIFTSYKESFRFVLLLD